MPYNVFNGNTYKYILTGIDVPSRYKVARALNTKKPSKVVNLGNNIEIKKDGQRTLFGVKIRID